MATRAKVAKSKSKKQSITSKKQVKKPIKLAKKETTHPKTREEIIHSLILDHRENGKKLARSIMKKWGASIPQEEIDSLVDFTLCEAAQRYDASKGASFVTFLFYYLRGQLIRAVNTATSEQNLYYTLLMVSGEELPEHAKMLEDDSFAQLPETFYANSISKTPEELLLQKESYQICNSAKQQLDELESTVLNRSYENDEALVDIAKSLGYSRCHISRVKQAALEQLKTIINLETQENTISHSAVRVTTRRKREQYLKIAA